VSDIEIIAATITAAAGVVAAAIRWGVRRLAKSQDRATEALIRNAESNGALAAKFDALADRIGDRIDQLAERLDRVVELLGAPVGPVRRVYTAPRDLPAVVPPPARGDDRDDTTR
jgi:hypothetical protein